MASGQLHDGGQASCGQLRADNTLPAAGRTVTRRSVRRIGSGGPPFKSWERVRGGYSAPGSMANSRAEPASRRRSENNRWPRRDLGQDDQRRGRSQDLRVVSVPRSCASVPRPISAGPRPSSELKPATSGRFARTSAGLFVPMLRQHPPGDMAVGHEVLLRLGQHTCSAA